MIGRIVRRDAAVRIRSRVEHPEAILLAVGLAAAAAPGWLGSVFWLAVAIGLQLAVGGLGTVAVLGPVQPGLGFARYAIPAVSGVAVTLLGRQLADVAGLAMLPAAAFVLWAVLRLELSATRSGRAGFLLDLALVAVVFASAAGIGALLPRTAWPPAILLVVLLTAVPALRSAEARGRSGVEAVGHAVLHLAAVAQVGTALALLNLQGVVAAAILALAFHAWGGAAEALDHGASARAVALEFGALAVLGVIVALLLHAG